MHSWSMAWLKVHLGNLAGRAIAVVVPVHSGNLALAVHIAGNALHNKPQQDISTSEALI